MSIPYIPSSMALVRAEQATISYPFIEDGDTSTKVYRMQCSQLATDYDAAQIALDTAMSSATAAGVVELPFAADSAAYFVGDTGHSREGALVYFTRTFANIPQTTTLATGSEFYTFPGYAKSAVTVDDLYTEVGVTGIFVTLNAAHGLAVGDDAPLRNVRFYNTADAPPSSVDYKSFAVPDTTWGNKDYFTDYEILEVVDNVTFRIDPTISPSAPTAGEDLTVTQGDFYKDYGDGNIISMLVNPSGAGVLITTDVPHLAGQGEDLSINLQYKIDSGDTIHSVNGTFKLISAPSPTTFVIDIGRTFSVAQSLTVQPGGSFASTGDKNRSPISMNVSTDVVYTYILPGVTRGYTTAEDVKAAQPFQVYDVRDGSVVDTCYDFAVRNFINLTVIRTQTSPTATEYARMVSTEANIVIESSVSEWAGNILVIATKTCKAR